MEEKNRHNFCDRTARSWMPTRKKLCDVTSDIHDKANSFVPGEHPRVGNSKLTPIQQCWWIRCCEFEAGWPCLSRPGVFFGRDSDRLLPF